MEGSCSKSSCTERRAIRKGAVAPGEFTSVEKRAYLEFFWSIFQKASRILFQPMPRFLFKIPLNTFYLNQKVLHLLCKRFVLLAREAGIPPVL